VPIAVPVLPSYFREVSSTLAGAGLSRSFVIEIQGVPISHIRQEILDERLENISDDLSPAMGK
jgi:hypothetical protein